MVNNPSIIKRGVQERPNIETNGLASVDRSGVN